MISTLPVAVVTGAAQGIGRRVAEVLALAGYALVLADLNEPTATVGAVTEAGAQAITVVGDVSAQEYVDELARQVATVFGRVDALVNNAGVSLLRAAEETTPEQWRQVLEVGRALGRVGGSPHRSCSAARSAR